MTRLPALTPDMLSPEQGELYDKIAGDKRRQAARGSKGTDKSGALSGPFNALLHAPQLGNTVQRLGAQLRFESSLPGHLRELAILMGAQHWRANYEWFAHAPIAAREGLDASVIMALKQGELPPDAPEDVVIVHRFVDELVGTRRVCGATYEATQSLVGEQGLVELIAVIGHYTLIAGLLNVFEVGLPDGAEPPFGE